MTTPTRQPYTIVCPECGYSRQINPDTLMPTMVPTHCNKVMVEQSLVEYLRFLSGDKPMNLKTYTQEGYQQWLREREQQP